MKQLWNRFSKYGNFIVLAIIFFGFPQIEKPLVQFAENQINSLGIFAPLGYILFGTLSTVGLPIGLGPINIVLQRAFGFWPSVLYFWTYETIGLSINFLLSAKFGEKIIKFFIYNNSLDSTEKDPITKLSTYMLNKSYFSAFAVMLGFGGEILSYLAGLSKLSYLKFLSIIVITNFINALFFVGANLTIGTNNNLYIVINTLSIIITILPVLIIFRKEIVKYFTNIISLYKASVKKEKVFINQIQDFKYNEISRDDFNQIFVERFNMEIKENIQFIDAIMNGASKTYPDSYFTTELLKENEKRLRNAGIDEDVIFDLKVLVRQRILGTKIGKV
jgi:uncharacterized membrane protein YdjX (TVP38/TMEM64 family)